MWTILGFIIIVYLLYIYKYPKHGMSSSPYDMVQEQAGAIQKLHDQLEKLTLNDTVLKVLKDDNDTLSNNMNDFQANMPSDEPDRQYPSE
jgi:hypothetical protein